MFEDLSTVRLPRSPRRAMTPETIGTLERFAGWLDRSGANTRTFVRDATNNQIQRTRARAA